MQPTIGARFRPTITQAADPVTGITVTGAGGIGVGARGRRRARRHLREDYVQWTYVAIQRVAHAFAAQVPNLSVATDAPLNVTQSLRSHLRQHYARIVQADENLEPLADRHPLHTMFDSPNPADTWSEFAQDVILQWELTGRYYLWVLPNGFGLPSELWVVPTSWMEPVFTRDGDLEHWRATSDTGYLQLIPPEQIIFGGDRNPLNRWEPYSSLTAGDNWQENAKSIEDSRSRSLEQGINPDVLLMLDHKIYGNPNDTTLDRITKKFAERTSGTHRHGEPIAIPAGVNVVPWSRNPKEMDYGESASAMRDNLLALRGVHKIIAGLSEDVNRANANAARGVFCDITLNPKLANFAGSLQKIAARFDSRIRIWYTDCTPTDPEQELEETKADFAMGAITPDERRTERNREPLKIPQSETTYLSSSVVPIDLDTEPPPVNEPDDDEEPPEGGDE